MISADSILKCRALIADADLVLIGAGAGLSTAAGLHYGGKRFTDNFADYISKYKLTDMYSSAFYPWQSWEEKWGYFSRHIKLNRYDFEHGKPYAQLLELLKNKDYFVLSTNADGLFEKAGFNTNRIFAMQGDYTKFQCEKACHDTLYDNKQAVFNMVEQQKDCKVPSELVPICPKCGGNLVPHLRIDNYFVENADWHAAKNRYIVFLQKLTSKKTVLLEFGVGFNTPGIIRYPFEQFAAQFPQTTLIRVNRDDINAQYSIPEKSILIEGDIAEFINALA